MISGTVLHIIPTLQNGGAETVLTRLVEELANKNIPQFVVTLQGSDTDFNHQKVSQFAQVVHLKTAKVNLVQWLDENPNTKIIAWMYRPILFAHRLKSKSTANPDIYWNIRNSNFRYFQIIQRCSLYAFGVLSHLLKPKIIYCSNQAKLTHQAYFFSKQNQRVIPNRWAKVTANLPSINQPKTPTFLYVGRYDTMKGPKRLIKLFSAFVKKQPEACLQIAGSGWTKKMIPKEIENNVVLIGNTDKIYTYYANATALLFTSYSEGYPNVLVEAIVSGLPVIAFEAGDSKLILQDYAFGNTVKSNHSFLLAMEKASSHPHSLNERTNELTIQKEKLNFSKTVLEYLQFLSL